MHRIARLVLISMIVTMAWPAALVRADDAEDKLTQEYWLGIYFKGNKIGNAHVRMVESALDGRKVVRRERNWRLLARSDELNIKGEAKDVVYVTPAMEPVLLEIEMVGYDPDGGRDVITMTSRYEDDKCLLSVQTSGGKEMTATDPLDEEDAKQLLAGFAHDMRGDVPPASSKVDMQRFWMELTPDPPGLGLDFGVNRTALLLVGPQRIEIGKNTYDTTVVVEEERDSDEEVAKTVRRWLLKDGGIVKEEWQPSGITLLREPKEEATSFDNACPEIPPKPVEEQPSTTGEGIK